METEMLCITKTVRTSITNLPLLNSSFISITLFLRCHCFCLDRLSVWQYMLAVYYCVAFHALIEVKLISFLGAMGYTIHYY